MVVLDAIAADWWHSVTIGVLGLALFLEALAAYCRLNAMFDYGTLGAVYDAPLWQRPWLAVSGPRTAGYGVPFNRRYPQLQGELASLLRGTSRLSVAALFLARVASKQPALPIVDLGF
ncbi:MAG: hypothetical protein OXH97_06085 [Chloroflexota bacterium]|nr:hypothetical protein [Chloroflexota bacterium]